MNSGDPLTRLIEALVLRYELTPGRAWLLLTNAARRKGVTIQELVRTIDLGNAEPAHPPAAGRREEPDRRPAFSGTGPDGVA